MASLSVTGRCRFSVAAAIPCPMMPEPITPTDLIFAGLTSRPSTPGSFLLRSVRKKI